MEAKTNRHAGEIDISQLNLRISPLSIVIARTTSQKIIKDIEEFNNMIHQQDLINVQRTFHPKTAKYTFFSIIYRTFINKDHILRHTETSTNIKIIKIIQMWFSNHNGIKLEISNNNSWKLNNTPLNNPWVKKISQGNIYICISN